MASMLLFPQRRHMKYVFYWYYPQSIFWGIKGRIDRKTFLADILVGYAFSHSNKREQQ